MKKVKITSAILLVAIISLIAVPKISQAYLISQANNAPAYFKLCKTIIECVAGLVCIADVCSDPNAQPEKGGGFTVGGCVTILKPYCYWRCEGCGITSKGTGPLWYIHECKR